MSPDVKNEPSLDEAFATLIVALPKPVQEFVMGPDRPRIAIELSKKYNLHVDQAGVLERSFMLMLLGVSSPEEFVDSLTKAGLPPESVRGLAQDVNEQVFVPLRKAEQSGSPSAVRISTPQKQPVAAPITLPGSTEPVPVVAPRQAPAIPPAPVLAPPQVTMYPPQPMPMYGYIPQPPPQMMYAPPYGMPAPYGAPVYMWPQPGVAPQWPPQVAPPQQAPVPQQQTYVPSPQPPRPIAPPVATPAPTPANQPKATLNPSGPLQKNYSADPYRETFTE